jgi:hypothetical protein
MKQIRRGIFETNSSSIHSITIANNESDDFKNYLPEKLVFDVGEFGWEFDRYNDTNTKANYLYTGLFYHKKKEEYLNKIKETLEKWGVEVVYPEVNVAPGTYGPITLINGYQKFFYIDHSCLLDDFIDQVCNDEELLMNYLFSPESFIATGNDNNDRQLDVETNAKNILLEYEKGN